MTDHKTVAFRINEEEKAYLKECLKRYRARKILGLIPDQDDDKDEDKGK